MTTLSTDDKLVMRRWLGDDEPTDLELQTVFDVYESYDETVLHFLNKRMVDLSLEPASVTVPGLTVSHGADLEALKTLIKDFKTNGGTGLDEDQTLGFTISRMVRKFPR